MKLSLWQQFSSNHSASYTIVGEFDGSEAAHRAQSVLRQMMHEIDNCNRQFRPEKWEANAVEEQYAQMYSIEWYEPIDWLRPFSTNAFRVPFQRQLEEHVIAFDHIVVVDAADDLTWQTGHQFSDLLQAMGARTYAHVYDGSSPEDDHIFKGVRFRFKCLVPADAVGQDIYDVLASHLEHRSLTPWDRYHPRFYQMVQTSGLTEEQVQTAYESLNLWHNLNNQIVGYELNLGSGQRLQGLHPLLSFLR